MNENAEGLSTVSGSEDMTGMSKSSLLVFTEMSTQPFAQKEKHGSDLGHWLPSLPGRVAGHWLSSWDNPPGCSGTLLNIKHVSSC